jgi:hypothetical protein
MTSEQQDERTLYLSKPPVAVQILAIIGFTGFAIPVSIVAMNMFGLLGLLLAAFLGWQWTRLAGLGRDHRLSEAVDLLKPQVSAPEQSSGNSSFDAYRSELMQRLESEQTNFDQFLTRLRDAKDKNQFDTFMVERERIAQDNRGAV